MQTIAEIDALRRALEDLRAGGRSIALVPTMGYLHAGHLSLVEEAHRQADCVVASIFVNPLQFGADEDLDVYPRAPEEDAEKLAAAGVAILFSPTVEEVYPRPLSEQTAVEVPAVSHLYCGASRPVHFRGVATVVCKLLNIVQPDVAVFGEKDYQQLFIIRRMAQDLCLPVKIVGHGTQRDADGLALSSRNAYLGEEERQIAPRLYAELQQLRSQILAGEASFPGLVEQARTNLSAAGLRPDYVAICRQSDLQPAEAGDRELVILAAVWLGKTRLIDNVTV